MPRQGHEQIVTAGIAPRANEARGEDPAGQVSSELRLDVPGQPAIVVVAGVREEGLEVLLDDAVLDGLGWTPGGVRRREDGHETARFAGRVPSRRAFEGEVNDEKGMAVSWARGGWPGPSRHGAQSVTCGEGPSRAQQGARRGACADRRSPATPLGPRKREPHVRPA